MRLTTLRPLPLLACLLLAAPALATPGGEGGNSNCQGVGNPNSPCQPSDNDGGSQPNGNSGSDTNANNSNIQNSNINENNIANKNNNVNATNSASRSGASSNSSSHVSGLNATATGGTSTSSSRSYYERETPVAPLLNRADSATMEGVTVPLPTIGISGFYSNGDSSWNNDNRDDIGVTLGLRLPLGGGQFREAALRREKFQIVKEAIYLKEKGVLTYEAFPEHYVALYGAALSPTDAISSN